MLLRRLARPLFASWFVSQGLDALRHPGAHAQVVRDGLDGVRARVPLSARSSAPGPVAKALTGGFSDKQLATATQAHGAAMLVAGAMLAVGRAPRTAALALAGLTVPLVLVNLPVGRDALTPEEKKARSERLVRALSFAGGAVLVGVDLEGRPGVSWRVQHARADRAALKAARATEAAKHVDG
ncbi:DoxX family membrane protein [Cellulomonas dongxiuzhuiae]|uniref:DoxX family membrane protein n=1 Tax=Cellulomonas dongxiuzhuiae TaxID=2819979 RepID=UPI001AAEC178|nr:DoxX family membrane protein [Cellulomonas dongxiuzhuiae]MBO3087793.1 DoxX family membrane protein [Cellulomonas dongxiuzhuiae]